MLTASVCKSVLVECCLLLFVMNVVCCFAVVCSFAGWLALLGCCWLQLLIAAAVSAVFHWLLTMCWLLAVGCWLLAVDNVPWTC